MPGLAKRDITLKDLGSIGGEGGNEGKGMELMAGKRERTEEQGKGTQDDDYKRDGACLA